jgi:hypothetical protein
LVYREKPIEVSGNKLKIRWNYCTIGEKWKLYVKSGGLMVLRRRKRIIAIIVSLGTVLIFMALSVMSMNAEMITVDFNNTGYADGQKITESIGGLVFETNTGAGVYYGSNLGENSSGGIYADNFSSPVGTFYIRRSDGTDFKLVSMYMEDLVGFGSSIYTVEGYLDGLLRYQKSDVNVANFPYTVTFNWEQIDEIRVIATNSSYNVGAIFDNIVYEPIIADVTAPTVSTFSPTDNGVGVDVSDNLVITFDEPVMTDSGNVIIKKASDNSVVESIDVSTSGQVSGSGTNNIIINPTNNLDYGVEYYVEIGAFAFSDTSLNYYTGISDSTTWNFSTMPLVALSVDNTVISENGGIATVTATLQDSDGNDFNATQNVTIVLAYSGTAMSHISYTASGDSMVISIGETSNTITLTGINDSICEGDEIVLVDISSVTNGLESNTQQVAVTLHENDVPTDIALSQAFVIENSSSGTIVGTISSTDEDSLDTATYTLVSGTGSTDNESFMIDGTTLKTTESFDYEAKDSYSIRIQVTDSQNATYEEAFTISIINEDETPTAGSICLNHGDIYTTSAAITIELSAIGGDEMMISENSSFEGASYENYGTTKNFTLSDAEGLKTVYVKFRDSSSGDESEVFSDTIILDTISPTIETLSPSTGRIDVGLNDNLNLVLSEEVNKGTGNIVIIKVSDNSVFETFEVTTSSVMSVNAKTLMINPSMTFENGEEYYVQIEETAFTDYAGNAFEGILDLTTWRFTTVKLLSDDGSLSELSLSNGTLSPIFNSDNKAYTMTVDNSTNSVVVSTTTSSMSATVTVNGEPVDDEGKSGNLLLSVGTNTLTIVVTAEDGVTTNTYTIVVTRETASSLDSDEDNDIGGDEAADNNDDDGDIEEVDEEETEDETDDETDEETDEEEAGVEEDDDTDTDDEDDTDTDDDDIATSDNTRAEEAAVTLMVNGKQQIAGTETTTEVNGYKTVKLIINAQAVEEKIEEILENNDGTGAETNTIEIPVATTGATSIKTVLTGDLVKQMEEGRFELNIGTEDVGYIIKASDFNIDNVAKDIGASLDELDSIQLEIVINKLDSDKIAEIKQKAEAQNLEIVFPPVEFTIVAKFTSSTGETVEKTISQFTNYVERVMEFEENVDKGEITTGVVYLLTENGEDSETAFVHVPTVVYEVDGILYAKINSLTNSSYSVIYNSIEVESVTNHWSKETVNNMASRLIIDDPEDFMPMNAITRGDFIQYITKALGIYRNTTASEYTFSDVAKEDELAIAIEIAVDYGIINGYPDGTFKAEQNITREEAMVIFARAMAVANITATDLERIKDYSDYDQVSDWAAEAVKEVVGAGVFNGTSENTLSLDSTLTYAEAAQAIRNLLVEAGLINE